MNRGYVDMSAMPQYEFGFGLGYTRSEYANLRVTRKKIAAAGKARAELEVTDPVAFEIGAGASSNDSRLKDRFEVG